MVSALKAFMEEYKGVLLAHPNNFRLHVLTLRTHGLLTPRQVLMFMKTLTYLGRKKGWFLVYNYGIADNLRRI